MDAPDFRNTKISDIAFRDPLSEATRKTRAHLLFVGAFAILVEVYDLKVSKTPWLDIEIPPSAPQLLNGALSVALAYLFSVFAFYSWQDFRRWRLSGDLHLVHGSFDLILQSRNDLFAIVQHLDKITSPSPLSENVHAAIDAAAKRLPEAQQELESLQRGLRRLSRLQWFRLIVIEVGVPLTVGAVALAKTHESIGPFFSSVFK